MELTDLSNTLKSLGCPESKCGEMAEQLDKRARQLMDERNQSYEQSLNHLIGLMRQGWAAQANDQ